MLFFPHPPLLGLSADGCAQTFLLFLQKQTAVRVTAGAALWCSGTCSYNKNLGESILVWGSVCKVCMLPAQIISGNSAFTHSQCLQHHFRGIYSSLASNCIALAILESDVTQEIGQIPQRLLLNQKTLRKLLVSLNRSTFEICNGLSEQFDNLKFIIFISAN